jgi:hypothetical protein
MRRVFVAAVVLVAVVLVVRAWAAAPVKAFQGYWMGVDPVDGGDSRRGFLQLADGTFALAGRDSFLRLCDETDRGIVTFEDGTVVGHRVMTSDTVKLSCFGNGAVVLLKARYELVDDSLMLEHLTTQDDQPVHTLVLHKVSR